MAVKYVAHQGATLAVRVVPAAPGTPGAIPAPGTPGPGAVKLIGAPAGFTGALHPTKAAAEREAARQAGGPPIVGRIPLDGRYTDPGALDLNLEA